MFLGPIAKLLGKILEGLYYVLDKIGIANIGLCIIAFTIIVRLCLMPLTYKQQKFSKLSQAMNPELQAIQKKYKDKRDEASMMKMQQEQKAVYEKYGVSPAGSCLQMIIQMPILLALYRVIYNIPAYIPQLKSLYKTVISSVDLNNLIGNKTFKINNIAVFEKASSRDSVIDAMAKFSHSGWNQFESTFPNADKSSIDKINDLNSFCGINLSMTPMAAMGIALLIPVLAAVLQWYSTKLIQAQTMSASASDDGNPMAGSMKMMNNIMPIFTGVLCLTLQSGLGLYWIMGSVATIIQQLVINAHFKKEDVNDILKKNMEKQNKKREKQGLPPNKISTVAGYNTKKIDLQKQNQQAKQNQNQSKAEAKDSSKYYKNAPKPGSLAEKANLVKAYDEKNKKK